jgi:hypothetical protein
MAIGDAAAAAGLPLVPESGENGRVRWGSRELNRTRDMIAAVIATVPIGKANFRTATGISSGVADPDPATGNDGDIYFKIVG